MKQAIIMRQDLKLEKGKACSQSAHAAVECVLRSEKNKVNEWRKEGMPKIVLKVKDLKEMQNYNQLAKDIGLITSLITDAGRTVVEPGTITCLCIGPDDNKKIDSIIKDLKLY